MTVMHLGMKKVNMVGGAVYHHKDIVLTNISPICISHADWHVTEISGKLCQLCIKWCHRQNRSSIFRTSVRKKRWDKSITLERTKAHTSFQVSVKVHYIQKCKSFRPVLALCSSGKKHGAFIPKKTFFKINPNFHITHLA